MASPFRADAVVGKVALVTGGGSGIGYGIAEELARHGASVVLSGRRENILQAAVDNLTTQGLRASFVRGDVRDYASCENMVAKTVEKYGSLDILVCSHAGNFLSPAENLSPNGFRTVIDIDTNGVFQMCHASFRHLKASKGSVINISATLHKPATWYQVHSAAAKAAIDSVTRTLALEWGSYGIRVNGIAPGPIADTPGMTKLSLGMSPKELDEKVGANIALGRVGTKFDIAMLAVFLCSSGGAYITGDTIIVDGGQWITKKPPVPREVVSQISRQVEKKSRKLKFGSSKL